MGDGHEKTQHPSPARITTFARQQAAWSPGAARRGGLARRQILHRLAKALAEEPGRSPSLVRSILLANLSSEPVRQLLQQNLERGRTLLGELFAVVQQRGEIRRDLKASELARAF